MFFTKRFAVSALSLLAAGFALYIAGRPGTPVLAAPAAGPAYSADGEMLPPANYREWVFLSSGLGMSYTPQGADHLMFDNVFVNPEAYRSFLQTGAWPDKTMLVLEVREARNKGSINLHGHYQGTGVMGMEVHVKDTARFPSGWAFFDFDTPASKGTLIPSGAPCYRCHQDHGAVDTTFVQFYPTLLPIARQKGTLAAAYRKDSAANSGK